MEHTTLNNTSTGTTSINQWFTPKMIQVNELQDGIEMIYKETNNTIYASYPSPPPEERVFKIVFSCKGGKWHKSDRIYGKIISSTDESYEF